MIIQGPNPELTTLQVIGDEIKASLDAAPKNAIFRATVGYISDSGVTRLESSLKKIISQNGTVEVIVGLNQISKKSINALATLYNICGGIGVFVFWNPDINVTFHPKCYLYKKPRGGKIYIWIGSSNFTAQGLFSNYECNLHFVLSPKKDVAFITQIEDYFKKIRESDYCHTVDLARLTQFKSLKGIPRGEKPANDSPKIKKQIKNILGIKPNVTLPQNAFVMTLSKNDIDGKRWEPYFLIPLAAIQSNNAFWHWPLTKSQGSKYPSITIKANITVGQKKVAENRRIYFVKGKSELRFVSPIIYNLGLNFLGSILLAQKKNYSYQIEIIDKTDQRFPLLLKHATNVASNQKMWGYV
ncbi:MAG TPA: NgoFVII family restriction endonuclease [Candidatus Methanofastidiosum sp.]|nr:NgoFVII family restriction endonuclease [Methanofastidiosum sp.]